MESGRPFGITIASTAFSEGILIKLAYAFEQATKHRKNPQLIMNRINKEDRNPVLFVLVIKVKYRSALSYDILIN